MAQTFASPLARILLVFGLACGSIIGLNVWMSRQGTEQDQADAADLSNDQRRGVFNEPDAKSTDDGGKVDGDKPGGGPGDAKSSDDKKDVSEEKTSGDKTPKQLSLATFGSGCFWCTEAFFENLKGVKSVTSGFSGGHVDNPTYRQVVSGLTGHAEVVQVTYDPSVLSYVKLLEVFWSTHDPTTLNRQGYDEGTQYRSVIFWHDFEQRELAQRYKQKLDKSKVHSRPVVTEIAPFKVFYEAENYHQDYYELNGRDMYCRRVIQPKMEKFLKVFKDDLKKE